MSIMDLVGQALGGEQKRALAQQLGTDEKTTEKAMGAGLATILGALQRNASKPEGAQALHAALGKHDGSSLNDVSALIQNRGGTEGAGILKHVLGGKRNAVEQSLGAATGLEPGKTAQLLETLAPAVLGALGKQQKAEGMDAANLAGFLGKQRQEVEAKAPAGTSMIGKLLDQDGDGDFDLGDVAKAGLGKLFGK